LIDWNEVSRVAGIGFGTVFIVLSLLAVAIWIAGWIIYRLSSRGGEENSSQETGG
jgi:Na+-transporting methylmalonyl-CoA/oxaloacetate decarboxylase gamma subunit